MNRKIVSVFIAVCTFIIFAFSGCVDESVDTFNNEYGNNIPVYYTEYLSARVKQINHISDKHSIDHEFFFITDLHWEANTKQSPALINYIQQNCGVNEIIFGGDYIAVDYENKEDALNVMYDCVNSFDVTNFTAILGNHETNGAFYMDYPLIADEEAYSLLNKGDARLYFSRKDEEKKICSIFLNTNDFYSGNDQYHWLKNELISLDEEYTVLFFMHIYYSGRFGNFCETDRGLVLNKILSENAENIKCKIAGVFSGHCHSDYVEYNYGIPFISTACDSIGVYAPCDDAYYREAGTITEQAFDVVQVDLTERKIYLTRIGAGNDRVLDF